jgi:hypothetical protein
MNAPKAAKSHPATPVLTAGTLIALALSSSLQAQTQPPLDPLMNALIKKGILTQGEAEQVQAEMSVQPTNAPVSASKFKVPDSIKAIQLYGDVRLRYEYRGVDNAPGAFPDTYYKERFRYALRFGIRGELYDQFNYGIRLETATNPRSPWDTFGSDSGSATTPGSATPSDKAGSGLGIGQLFINWHPQNWYEMTAGRMPMPLYTTPMVWDSDINPDGAFEKFKYTAGDVDWFADFGQFDYQDPSTGSQLPSSDVFVLAWQLGAKVNFSQDMFAKIAPVFYNYTGQGFVNGLNSTFVGQGSNGSNIGVPGGSNVTGYNEEGINNLLILETPAEFDFKIRDTGLGTLQARLFGDFSYNFQGDDRARAAYDTNPTAFPGVSGPVNGQDKAYQVGFGIGSDGPLYGPTQGLVYGSTAKKNTWEARVYWQHVEQYALDVNLLDSDFFEGRGNLQGVYSAFAYSFTDAIIGTVRYGYANRIDSKLGTGGNNLDLPGINPVKNYNVVQLDLTWRF